MYYKVGECLKDYVFVYDSDDSSCELINKSELSDIALYISTDFKLQFYKLCTMLNIPQFRHYACAQLASIFYGEYNKYHALARLLIIKPEFIIDKFDFVAKWADMYSGYGFDTDYFLFLLIENYWGKEDFFSDLKVNVLGNNKTTKLGSVMLLPPVMAGYLLNICRNKRFDILEDSLFKYLFDNLSIDSNVELAKYWSVV